MTRKTERGWKYETLTHRDWAIIPSNLFCIQLDVVEKALKSLDSNPHKAFHKLTDMGTDGLTDYILRS